MRKSLNIEKLCFCFYTLVIFNNRLEFKRIKKKNLVCGLVCMFVLINMCVYIKCFFLDNVE